MALPSVGTVTRVAFFALLPGLAVGGALGLPVVLCLAGALSLQPSVLRQVFENRPFTILFLLAFTLWAGASLSWTVYPQSQQPLKLAVLVPLGLLFAAAAARGENQSWSQAGGLAAVTVLIPLLAVEAIWGLPLNRAAQPDESLSQLLQNTSRGITVLIVLAWAAAASLIAHGGGARVNAARLLLAGVALLSLQTDQLASPVAFGFGLAAFLLAFAAPRFAILATSVGAAGWLLAAPFATPLLLANQSLIDRLPDSWAIRAGMWDYACAKIWENPWIGHGIDASRAVTDRLAIREYDIRAVQLHPHSGSLQIWYELGLVGAALGALAILFGGWSLARLFAHNRAGAAATAGTIAAAGVIANVSYGVWQEWWIATLFVAAALVGALGVKDARA